jgi:hypothetical protein
MRSRRKRLLFIAPLAILGVALFVFIGGTIVMHLWNWLLPMLFGWRMITFWQALGLLILCRILFGNFGMRGGHRSRGREFMRERWQHMTPEQREKMRNRWRMACGFEPPPAEAEQK